MRSRLHIWLSAIGLTVLFLPVLASPALAWSQLLNDFDIGGNANCGWAQNKPCLYWNEPAYTSITNYAYLDPSLNQGSYDFTGPVNAAFSDFNNAPAYNPYTYSCGSPGCGSMTYNSGYLGCLVYGGTFPSHGASQYSSRLGGWYAFFSSPVITFNNGWMASWNSSLTWSNNSCSFQADGRKVATHETGHAQGLGHTSYTAVMHQGPENFYTLQTNDCQGLQAIYPGALPY